MRVNIYAEEMTQRVSIIHKKIDGKEFTGLRFWLELPATMIVPSNEMVQDMTPASLDTPGFMEVKQLQAPFIHHPGDDDSSAVTFWGKRDLREVLKKALEKLDEHYEARAKYYGTKHPEEPQ